MAPALEPVIWFDVAEYRASTCPQHRHRERGRPMELWQMDIVGEIHLGDGVEVKVVTGIDDNSRFVVCAKVVARATAGPVCEALLGALQRHGVPEQILTDNGKVFTGRFGPGGSSSEVLFDRVCVENGIRHLLTAPRSPTTTGKVERLHKTMRAEFFADADRVFATIGELRCTFTRRRRGVARTRPAWSARLAHVEHCRTTAPCGRTRAHAHRAGQGRRSPSCRTESPTPAATIPAARPTLPPPRRSPAARPRTGPDR